MKYGSVCSGIEAATVAWHPLGWQPQWFAEISPFPCRVLAHHYPHVPNLGDMTRLNDNKIFNESTINVLVGGTPCQSFSLAGLRAGMADERGNLALEYCRVLIAKRPRWFVWENVPGVFSSFSNETGSEDYSGIDPGNERCITETSDFATLLAAFQECGYSCCWRVYDSQYFGVAQRRRRVFVVGHLGDDWRPPFAVLFERDSLRGNIKKGKKTRETVVETIDASAGRSRGAGTNPGMITVADLTRTGVGVSGADDNQAQAGHIIPWPADKACTLNAAFGKKMGLEDQYINSGAPLFVPMAFMHGQSASGDIGYGEVTPPIRSANNMQPAVVYPMQQITSKANGSNPKVGDPAPPLTQDGNFVVVTGFSPISIQTSHTKSNGSGINETGVSYTLDNSGTPPAVLSQNLSIRRLTPLECERLQGFKDNYTNIPGAKDSPRYEAIGNSMTRQVMEHIGKRIDKVDKLINK